MPSEVASRWNSRYLEGASNSFDQPRSLLVNHADLLPTSGLALDLAMGTGGNAGYLLKRGLRVCGVDISYVGVSKAHAKYPALMAIVADLERFSIPPGKFDVILDFLYLQRNLWQPIYTGLKTGGVVFIECLTEDMLSIHPEINPAYLLKTGELRQVFSTGELGKNLEILYYHEGWQTESNLHRRAMADLIARRNS